MSETRRDIFRRSIFSAIGGVIAGALGGCAIGRETESFADGPTGKGGGSLRPFVSPLAGSVVAVYGQDNIWYFFKFGPSDLSQCQLLSLPPGTPFPGTHPSATNPIDTYTLCSTLRAQPVPTSSQITIKYNKSGGGVGSIAASFSGGAYLDGNGLQSLLHALVDMNQIATGSWNEIGHN